MKISKAKQLRLAKALSAIKVKRVPVAEPIYIGGGSIRPNAIALRERGNDEALWNIDYEIYESPPQKRTIKIRKISTLRFESYRLGFPFSIFVSVKASRGNAITPNYTLLFAYWSRIHFDGQLSSEVGVPLLPNIFETGQVCLGGSGHPSPLELIDLFWNKPFSPDDAATWREGNLLGHTELKSYLNWEKMTKKNSKKIMQIYWPRTITLREGLSSPFSLSNSWYNWITNV
jgi:hypothetical protein